MTYSNHEKKFFIWFFIFITVSPLFEYPTKVLLLLLAATVLYLRFDLIYRPKISDLILCLLFLMAFYLWPMVIDVWGGRTPKFVNSLGIVVFALIGFLISFVISKKDFLDANERLSILSIVIGLPVFLYIIADPSNIEYVPSYSFKGQIRGYSLGFVNFLIHEYGLSGRFTGFAREPGVLQMLYLLALWNRLQRLGNKLDFLSILIITAIFFSKSTAGIAAMFMLLALSVDRKNAIIYLLLIGAISLYFRQEFLNIYEYKLFGSYSFSVRYDRYSYFLSNDIFRLLTGHGNAGYDIFFGSQQLGGWDTVLMVTQRYGILGVLLIYGLLVYKNYRSPGIWIVIGLSFFSQSVWFYPIVSFFYFSRDNLARTDGIGITKKR